MCKATNQDQRSQAFFALVDFKLGMDQSDIQYGYQSDPDVNYWIR